VPLAEPAAPQAPVDRLRRITLVLAILLSVAALIQGHHRAGKGHNALLKWEPVFVALEEGEPIYETGVEGYPTLPLSLMVMSPFRATGSVAGPLLWACFKLAIAWWIVLSAMRMVAEPAHSLPGWGQLAVLLLVLRPLYSDLQHGNINLLVAGSLLAAALAWHRGNSFASGMWIGLGMVLKVTPALALVFFAARRSGRALAGALVGVGLLAFVAPGLWLGWERNLELSASWWNQMITPALAGRDLTLLQTEHINQSLLGVLARHLTDCVAIVARPPIHAVDVSIHWFELSGTALRRVHLALSAVIVTACVLRSGPRGDRSGPRVLGQFSSLALAMLILSERSWKHHYVTLALPVAFLVGTYWRSVRGAAERRVCGMALTAACATFALSSEAVLGARGSDLAEALGAQLLGALVLFLACIWLLGRSGRGALGPDPVTKPDPSPSGPHLTIL